VGVVVLSEFKVSEETGVFVEFVVVVVVKGDVVLFVFVGDVVDGVGQEFRCRW
jgi:hypothetical protein